MVRHKAEDVSRFSVDVEAHRHFTEGELHHKVGVTIRCGRQGHRGGSEVREGGVETQQYCWVTEAWLAVGSCTAHPPVSTALHYNVNAC